MVSPDLGVRTQVTRQLFWKGQPSHRAEEVEMGRGLFSWDDEHRVQRQKLGRQIDHTLSRNINRTAGFFVDRHFEMDGGMLRGGIQKVEDGSYFTGRNLKNKSPVIEAKLNSSYSEQTSESQEIISISKEPNIHLEEEVLIPGVGEKTQRQMFSWESIEASSPQAGVSLKNLEDKSERNKELAKMGQTSNVELNNQKQVQGASQKKCIRKIHVRRDGKRVFLGKLCYDVCKCQKLRYRARGGRYKVLPPKKVYRKKNRQRIIRDVWKHRLCRQVLQHSGKNLMKECFGKVPKSEGNEKAIKIASRKKKSKWFAPTRSKTAVLRRRAE